MLEGKSGSPAEPQFNLPPAVLARSQRLLDAYADIVQRTSAFSIEVADAVRDDPEAVADLVHELAAVTAFAFQRWNLDILYMLSLVPQLRYSQISARVHGISNRSLSMDRGLRERLGRDELGGHAGVA